MTCTITMTASQKNGMSGHGKQMRKAIGFRDTTTFSQILKQTCCLRFWTARFRATIPRGTRASIRRGIYIPPTAAHLQSNAQTDVTLKAHGTSSRLSPTPPQLPLPQPNPKTIMPRARKYILSQTQTGEAQTENTPQASTAKRRTTANGRSLPPRIDRAITKPLYPAENGTEWCSM